MTQALADLETLTGNWLEYRPINWIASEYLLEFNRQPVMYLQQARALGIGNRPRVICKRFVGYLASTSDLPMHLRWLAYFGIGNYRNVLVTFNDDVLASQLQTSRIFLTDPIILEDGNEFYWGDNGFQKYSIVDPERMPIIVGERNHKRLCFSRYFDGVESLIAILLSAMVSET